ncbi:hypothetical protein TNCV_885991 [Trichonephila clavipes]|nr:hypothetical protein TNCV_885991 [Trichonephila clavipes]
MNETTQQEKTTQLSSRNERLNSAAGTNNSTRQQERTTQLGSRNETTQLVSRNETTQLCIAVDRLHRLYSRVSAFSTYSCLMVIFKIILLNFQREYVVNFNRLPDYLGLVYITANYFPERNLSVRFVLSKFYSA